MIGIVDYGRGNLRSVEKALEKVGFEALIMTSPKELSLVDGLILPGVGAFADAMEALNKGDGLSQSPSLLDPVVLSWGSASGCRFSLRLEKNMVNTPG